jgi:hypothetical protein
MIGAQIDPNMVIVERKKGGLSKILLTAFMFVLSVRNHCAMMI